MIEFAGIWRDMPKIVFSRTLEQAGWNTTIVREVVPEQIGELKAQPGGDLVIGGSVLAAAFWAHDLIDELRLYVQPVLLGRGRLLFQPSDAMLGLRLAETRPFGNGVVLLRYERPALDRCESGVALEHQVHIHGRAAAGPRAALSGRRRLRRPGRQPATPGRVRLRRR